MNCQYELTVIDGFKSGASAPVRPGAQLTIGDQIDCDIVLGELSNLDGLSKDRIEPSRATIRHNSASDAFSIQQLRGSVLVGGLAIAEGAAIDVALGTSVEIAGSMFVLHEIEQANSVLCAMPTADRESKAEPVDSSLLQAPKVAPKKTDNTFKYFGIAAAVCVAITAGLTYWIDSRALNSTEHDRASNLLLQIMAGAEYSQIELQQSGDGAIKVVGYVQQRSDLQLLRQSLHGMEKTVFVDVRVGEIMAESVASVFRVNNLEAVASSLASGEVLVKTTTSDLQLLDKVEAIAYVDVVGLKGLKIENSPPAAIQALVEPAGNDFETVPGKRIVMVMVTEPTYILTEDGSRYFTGSILPSGHKVKAILEKKVELELNQNTIEVVF
ncbi:MAG: hypothetical protein V3U65_13460 [Granulosicoccaceae bacterium]